MSSVCQRICTGRGEAWIAAMTSAKSIELRFSGEGSCMERSASRHALGVDVERVERGAGRHEQAVSVGAAEAEVGAALRQIDASDQLAVRVEDRHAVEPFLTHPPPTPEIAVD